MPTERSLIPLSSLPPAPGPPLALVMEAPRRATSMVLGRLAPLLVAGEQPLYVVDGANGFTPYVFSREARRRGLREDVLDRVFVTRAFTIHQLSAVTERMLPGLLRPGEPPPAIAVLGLDHLFLEESLRVAERTRVLTAVMADLQGLSRAGAHLLVTHERLPEEQPWWKPLREFGDIRARALPQGDNEWTLKIERCPDGTNPADLQYLAPGGDRLLEGIPPRPPG